MDVQHSLRRSLLVRAASIALGALLLCAAASAARADDAANAGSLVERAAAQAAQGRRRAAIALYEQAYAAEPRRELALEIAAQYDALAAAGDPRDVRLAILRYEASLAGEVPAPERAFVESRLSQLRARKMFARLPPEVAVRVEGGALWVGPGTWTQAWSLPATGPVTGLTMVPRCAGGGHEVTFLQGGVAWHGELYAGRRPGRLVRANPAEAWTWAGPCTDPGDAVARGTTAGDRRFGKAESSIGNAAAEGETPAAEGETPAGEGETAGPRRFRSPALMGVGIGFITVAAALFATAGALATVPSPGDNDHPAQAIAGILALCGAGLLGGGIPMVVVGSRKVRLPVVEPLWVKPLAPQATVTPAGLSIVGRF